MNNALPGDVLDKVIRERRQKWHIDQKFPNGLMIELMELARCLSGGSVGHVDACSSALAMVKESSDRLDCKIMLSISQIFQSFPMEPVMQPLNEFEFITKYLLPILQPLFDGKTITQAIDIQKSTAFANRPDCIVSIMQSNYSLGNLGYGEVKSPLETGNHFGANKDLLRLGLFCKATVDDQNLDGSLTIHCTGFMIIFYLVELHTDGLYLMTEICHLTFPSAIEDGPAFLTNASKLKNVVYTFESRCTPAKDPAKILSSPKQKRATAPTSSMDMTLKKSSSRKRRNIVSHFPN